MTRLIDYSRRHDQKHPTARLADFAKYARARPWYFLLFSAFFEIVYWLLLWVFLRTIVFGFAEFGFGVLPFLLLLNTNPLLSPFLWFALIELCGRFRKKFRVNAQRIFIRSVKPPMLYLRSFYYENPEQRPYEAREKPISVYERENDDEVLASALKQLGPFIAVGTHHTRLPPLGSIRLCFSQEEWREQIKSLMKICRLVFIQPGYSDGTEWEMQTAKEMLLPEKVIYSFLSWQNLNRKVRQVEFEVFALQIKRIYGCELPERIGNSYFLYFTKEDREGIWRPHLVKMAMWKRPLFWICSRPSLIWRVSTTNLGMWKWVLFPIGLLPSLLRRLPVPRVFRKYSVPGVRETLRPILKEKGIKLPIWRTASFFVLIVGFVALLSYARIFFTEPLGEYVFGAYDARGQIVFAGNMHAVEPPLNGTAELSVVSSSAKPNCFSTKEMANKSISCRFRVVPTSTAGYSKITFSREISESGSVLFFGFLPADPNDRPGNWYLPEPSCFDIDESSSGRLIVRHKHLWEVYPSSWLFGPKNR